MADGEEITHDCSFIILERAFKSNGHVFYFKLGEENVSWGLSEKESNNVKTKSKSKSDDRSLEYCEILNATLNEDKDSFTLIYIDKKSKFIWRRGRKIFESNKEEGCEDIVKLLKEKLQAVPQRPKNLIVFVNPVSGKKAGLSVHKKLVLPILEEAEIKAEHIVSTHAGHIKEYLAENDTTKYDGVVVVGGDGTLTEACHGLFLRVCNLNNLDVVNNVQSKIPPLPLKIGIVPAGTGQGMVKVATNTTDAETALLHIIRGNCQTTHCISMYNGGKLCGVATMLYAYGLFGDSIRESESRRWMGRLRYVYGMGKVYVKHRVVQAEVSYLVLQSDDEKAEAGTFEQDNKTEVCGATAGDTGWKKSNKQSFKAVDGFLFDLATGTYVDYLMMNMIDANVTRIQHGKFFVHLMMSSGLTESEALQKDLSSEHIQVVKTEAVKIKLIGHTSESLQALSTTSKREVFNLDGEPIVITHPEVELRFHKGVVQLYGYGDVQRQQMKQEHKATSNEK